MQLAVLRRARFGRSSEKLDRDIEQLELLIGELEEEDRRGRCTRWPRPIPPGMRHSRMTRSPRSEGLGPRKNVPVRARLPDHLPRETVTHEPACTCPGCGGTVFSRIGQDEREVLEYIPSSFKVIQHVRPKLSCRACEDDRAGTDALAADRAGACRGPGLLAHVAVSKFCDHLPLHRQSVHLRARRRRAGSRDCWPTGWGKVVFPAHPHWPRRSAAISAPASRPTRRRHHRAGAGSPGSGEDCHGSTLGRGA